MYSQCADSYSYWDIDNNAATSAGLGRAIRKTFLILIPFRVYLLVLFVGRPQSCGFVITDVSSLVRVCSFTHIAEYLSLEYSLHRDAFIQSNSNFVCCQINFFSRTHFNNEYNYSIVSCSALILRFSKQYFFSLISFSVLFSLLIYV